MNTPDAIDPIMVLKTLIARWRLIIACVALCLGLAISAALLSIPYFRSETLLSFNDERASGMNLSGAVSQLGGLASLAGINVGGSENQKDIAIAMLTSRGFLETFIQTHQLLPMLFSEKWNSKTREWKKKAPTISDGVDMFRDRLLTVNEDRRTGLVRVAVEWKDRHTAATWTNELVSQLNEVTRAGAVKHTRISREYLEAALSRSNVVELRESINRLLEAELKKELVASVSDEYSFHVIDRAMPSDPEDSVRPRRLLLVAFGLFSGFILGCALALGLHAWRRSPSSP